MPRKPSKCIITMGQKITKTDYSGPVSGINMLNASIAVIRDTNQMTGMAYKEIFALVDEGVGAEVFRKKPTMRASESEATAAKEEDDEVED